MEKPRNAVMALRSKMDVGNEIRSNRELLKTIKFDEILGECGLYFTSTKSTAAMNAEDFMKAHGGSGSAEFVLAIHLVPIHYIDNNKITYRTPVQIDTLRIQLKTFASLLGDMYGIIAPKLFHVSKCLCFSIVMILPL
jgi:hypothetical protein